MSVSWMSICSVVGTGEFRHIFDKFKYEVEDKEKNAKG
jgi:hypothetical protein